MKFPPIYLTYGHVVEETEDRVRIDATQYRDLKRHLVVYERNDAGQWEHVRDEYEPFPPLPPDRTTELP